MAAMASTTATLILGVAVALLVIYGSMLLWRWLCSKYLNLPPGPRALPIVGSMHLLGTHPHRSLAELASQYGPLMSVWLGQRLCIVASTPEAAKEFLKLQDANFAFRPSTRAAEIVTFGACMDTFYKKMIDKYKEDQRRKPIKEVKKTLLDIILEQLDFPKNGVTEEHIDGIIYDLLAAGIETTTTTIEWAMVEVLHNPTLLTKATSELDRVVGMNRTKQESDLPHLKYLHAIVKETLRLHPPVPLLIPHQSKVATKAFGYNTTTTIGRSLRSLFRRGFLREGNKATEFLGQHFELLAFVMVHLQVASLLHAFEWEAQELELEEARPTMTLSMRQPLIAVAKTRLPLHLYK